MDTQYNSVVTVEMSRHDAKELLAFIKTSTPMPNSVQKRILSELRDGLKPTYHYEIPCYDCRKIIEVTSHKKMTFAQVIEAMDRVDGLGILCSHCLDNYK